MTASNPTPPSLGQLQRWLRWALTCPRGAAAALAEPHPTGREPRHRYWAPSPACDAWVLAANPRERIARLDVYAEGYFQRITEALEQDYSALARAVTHLRGRAGFLRLMADYLKAHPTRSFTLGEAGRRLAPFLADRPDTAEAPWLVDLARLEWALVLAFHADGGPTLRSADLHGVPADAWPGARFRIDPSIHLLNLSWPVDALWLAADGAAFTAAVDRIQPRPTPLIVLRREGAVRVQPIDAAAARLLRALQEGQSLEAVCALAERLPAGAAGTVPTEQLMAWFGEWIAAGWIGRVIRAPEAHSAEPRATAFERNPP